MLGGGGSAGAEHEDGEFDRGKAARVNMASNKPQGAPATPPEDLQSKLKRFSLYTTMIYDPSCRTANFFSSRLGGDEMISNSVRRCGIDAIRLYLFMPQKQTKTPAWLHTIRQK